MAKMITPKAAGSYSQESGKGNPYKREAHQRERARARQQLRVGLNRIASADEAEEENWPVQTTFQLDSLLVH